MSLTPAQIEQRLQDIEEDLAARQNGYGAAAEAWYRLMREREHKHAVEFMGAPGNTTERREYAKRETALIGMNEEALYEAMRAVVKVLEARSMIGMALLKSARAA